VQADWHQDTGYLPITNAAYELGQSQGYYASTPGSDIAIKQITRGTPSDNSKGVRFGNFVADPYVVDEEFEAMLAGTKTAQQALDAAVPAATRCSATSKPPTSSGRRLNEPASPSRSRVKHS
jgi:sn-glycerol 3-phosphate transport system substrate-binding protein